MNKRERERERERERTRYTKRDEEEGLREMKRKVPIHMKPQLETMCTFVRNQMEEAHQRTYKTSGTLLWRIFSREGKQPESAALPQSVRRRPGQQ